MLINKCDVNDGENYKFIQKKISKLNYFVDNNLKLDIDYTSYIKKEDHTKYIDHSKLIEYLAETFECEYIIDVGCTYINNLLHLKHKYKIVGINLNLIDDLIKYDSVYYIDCDLNRKNKINISEKGLRKSIIVCSNVLEKIDNKGYLLSNIKDFMEHCKIGLISTLDRLITNSNEAKWTLSEFKKVLKFHNYNLDFIGLSTKDSYLKENILCILGNNKIAKIKKDIEDFRVVSIIAAYNEEDIIYDSVQKMVDNDIEVYIIENWSTDSTFKIVQKLYEEKKIIGYERLPKEGPPEYGELKKILQRKEELTSEIDADWFIQNDVDEIIESPWVRLNLKEAIYRVDKMGYNAINLTCVNYSPIDNGFTKGDFENYFEYFNFYNRSIKLIRMWKNTKQHVDIASNGGHDSNFKNRKVFAFKFLLKHYAIRSKTHGIKKYINDRQKRWDPEECKYWHGHTKIFNPSSKFLFSPENTILYNEKIFMEYYLLERLLGKYEYDQYMREINLK